MTRAASFMLELRDGGWRLARAAHDDAVEVREVAIAGDASPESSATELAAVLAELGRRGQGVCLALPSSRVLVVGIDCGDLPRKAPHAAKLYRLEEQLPVDAENLTADFLPPVGARALGVAVDTRRVRAVVDGLAEAGIETACICPVALLALWEACSRRKEPADFVVIAGESSLEVFRLFAGRPAAWHTVPASAQELVRCLDVELLNQPAVTEPIRASVLGAAGAGVLEELEARLSVTVEIDEEADVTALAARAARRLLAGTSAGWVDLRRDGLAPASPWSRVSGLLSAAMVLGVAFLSALSIAFYWRGLRYERLERAGSERQAAEYRRLYPEQPLPTNVRSRLASESRRLSGVSGAGLDVPERTSALEVLRRVSENLPSAVRLRLVELRIEPGDVFLDGEAPSHTEAELVSRGLRSGGFDAAAPRTEGLSGGGVSFRIYAKLGTQAGTAAAAGGAP